MADTDRTQTDAIGQLFDELDRVTAGMLGVTGSGQHMQPMAHYVDRDERALYFITSSDTDLVKTLQPGAVAHHCLVGKDRDYHACIEGPLTVVHDDAKLDDLWSRVAAAWFEGGREDARVTLLKLDITEAAVWASTGSAVVFGLEIARSNMSKEHTPDVGEHRVIDFRKAA